MTRAEAIGLLVERDLVQLTSAKREALLLDWHIDAADPEQQLRIALRETYTGVLSSYLQRQIATLGGDDAVVGEPEILEPCPCCGYRTLAERGGYDICPVCFWEDDGTSDLDCRSDPNRMTLREARANFRRFGAVSEADSRHVLPDGKQRYASS